MRFHAFPLAADPLAWGVILDEAIERLYDLNVGITVGTALRGGPATRHERPHKPLLLLAAFDLIDEGKATPDRIPWCQAFSFLPSSSNAYLIAWH